MSTRKTTVAARCVRFATGRSAVRLPIRVTGDAIFASYDAGVLTVRVKGAYAGTQAQSVAITK